MQNIEIKIEGSLDKNWVEWLDGFEISQTQQREGIETRGIAGANNTT